MFSKRLSIIVISSILTLVFLMICVRNTIVYRSVHVDTYYCGFVVPFIARIVLFLKKGVKEKKEKIWLAVTYLLMLVIIGLFVFTAPKYTYEEGKKLVKDYVNHEVTFADYEIKQQTIPIVKMGTYLFIEDRAYYYRILSDTEYEYYLVIPMTGYVTETKPYWPEDLN